MVCLVIGSHGLIGQSTVAAISARGVRVVAVDKAIFDQNPASDWKVQAGAIRASMVEKAAHCTYVLNPLRNRQAFLQLIEEYEIDSIVNIGGESLASDFSAPAAVTSASMGQLNQLLASLALEHGSRYVYISSSMVYGDFASDPVHENASKTPVDPYGAMKLGCELLIRAIGYQNDFFDYVILRPSAVYGPLDSNERVLVKMLHRASEGRAFTVHNMEARLDFTYVDDVGAMIADAVTYPSPVRDVFNVANGAARSLAEAVTIFRELLGDFPVRLAGSSNEDIVRPRRGALGMEKFFEVFGSVHARDLEVGLRQILYDSIQYGLLEESGSK